ncbi:MAG: ethanolamine utilization microcompartment protein EutL [Brevinemataceae bacterium]
MKGERLPVNVLAARMIPNIDENYKKYFNIPAHHRSLALFTTDCDDVGYVALDEATKMADVSVALAKSFYAGAGNASTKYAGEFIGVLSGTDPAEVKSGLTAAIDFAQTSANFISANEDNSVVYFAHCVSRTGSFLSKSAGIPEGSSLAYLVAPPLEALFAIDEVIKSADVKIVQFTEPPSETNFAAALLTGSQSACQAACDAFAEAVRQVAANPLHF